MFYTGEPIYCPIIGYEIWNVFNGSQWLKTNPVSNDKPWEKKFSFDEANAELKFFDTSELIDWKIFVVAKNKKKSSSTDNWAASFKVVPGPKYKP